MTTRGWKYLGDKQLRSASYKSRQWLQVIRQFQVAVVSVIPTEKGRP